MSFNYAKDPRVCRVDAVVVYPNHGGPWVIYPQPNEVLARQENGDGLFTAQSVDAAISCLLGPPALVQ